MNEVQWIRIFGIDQDGKKWLIAKATRHWLRNKPESHELQVWPIPTGPWTEVPAGQ